MERQRRHQRRRRQEEAAAAEEEDPAAAAAGGGGVVAAEREEAKAEDAVAARGAEPDASWCPLPRFAAARPEPSRAELSVSVVRTEGMARERRRQ